MTTLRDAHLGLVTQVGLLRERMARMAEAETRAEAQVLTSIEGAVDRVCEAARVAGDLAEQMAADGRLVGDGATDGVKRRLLELQQSAGAVLVALGKMGTEQEKRIARLVRAVGQADNAARKEEDEIERLARSGDPRDRAKVILGALDELPVDIAKATIQSAIQRAAARDS